MTCNRDICIYYFKFKVVYTHNRNYSNIWNEKIERKATITAPNEKSKHIKIAQKKFFEIFEVFLNLDKRKLKKKKKPTVLLEVSMVTQRK